MAHIDKKYGSPTKTPLETHIQDFLEYCEIEKNKSRKTIRNYDHYLGRFSNFARDYGVVKPADITLDTVRKYRLFLNRLVDDKGKTLKLITQSYHVIALRAFLKYLMKHDIDTLSPEKIELAKNPTREIHALGEAELSRIMRAAADEPEEIVRLRDLAILHTLFASGVRISELVQLTIKMIDLGRGEFTVRGKGDKLRLVFLSGEAAKAIEAYLAKRTDSHPALFIAHTKAGQSVTAQMDAQGKLSASQHEAVGLSARSVQRLIHKYAMLAGVTKKVTPHVFRHSFATDLLRNGADIRSVQTMLGHASITTTQLYTHVTNEQLREVHKKFHDKSK